MIPLHQIQIVKPCPADWNAMTGDVQARFCAHCKRQVHDLSQMTEAQAQTLLDHTNLNACVRITRTADGRILNREASFTPKRINPRTRRILCPPKPRTQVLLFRTAGVVSVAPVREVTISPPLPPVVKPAPPTPVQSPPPTHTIGEPALPDYSQPHK